MRRYKTRRSPRLIVLQSCPHPFSRQQRATYRASIVGSVVFSLLKIVGDRNFPARAHTLRRLDHNPVRSRLPSRPVFLIRGQPRQVFSYLNRLPAPRNRRTHQTDHSPRRHHKGYRRWGDEPCRPGAASRLASPWSAGRCPDAPKLPPLLGSLLANHMMEIAAIDIFVVPPLAVQSVLMAIPDPHQRV